MKIRARRVASFGFALAACLIGAGAASASGAKRAKAKVAEETVSAESEDWKNELSPEDAAQIERIVALEKSLSKQSGKVKLKDGLATINVPAGYHYIGHDDAEKVLVEWGNPPGTDALGMLYPDSTGLFGSESWAVVVSYSEEGHVKDDEAQSLDYEQMLKDMKENVASQNEERVAAGYQPLHLLGWAEPPHYDSSSKKLYWAKELKSDGAPESTLNYAIRALGREGVLELNAVASMGQLSDVKVQMKEILTFVEFSEGSRYSDFNPSVDKLAAYGIGALIVGKVAAKAGLIKVLLGFLIAGKKVIVLALLGLGAGFKALLGRLKKTPQAASAVEPAAPEV